MTEVFAYAGIAAPTLVGHSCRRSIDSGSTSMDCPWQWHCHTANRIRRRYRSHCHSSLVAAVLFGLTAALSVAGARRGGGRVPSAKSLGDQMLAYSLGHRVDSVVYSQFGFSLLEMAADSFRTEFEKRSGGFR